MRILGIDPGSSVTGFGCIESVAGRLSLVHAGAIRAPRSAALPERLQIVADELHAILGEYRPHSVSVERVFHHVNVQSALVLAHVRGAILLEAARAGPSIHEYTALQIKKALTGHGHAGKEQVRSMVLRLLAAPRISGPHDVSDALAIAICHAHSAIGAGMRNTV